MEQSLSPYRCIECGHVAAELYKDFNGGGVIKISHCEKCSEVVDKYIEYDPVLIFLDAILHKRQAYRHLLFNMETSIWKLALIYLLCDAYMKWDGLEATCVRRELRDEHIFYAALEWDIYTMFFISVLEWIFFTFATVALLTVSDMMLLAVKERHGSQGFTTCAKLVHRVLIISSFGKLLAIPAVIWGQTHSSIYLSLAKVFVLTSNISAIATFLNQMDYRSSFLIVVITHAGQYAVGQCLMQSLYNSS